jgi:hypothetical protein
VLHRSVARVLFDNYREVPADVLPLHDHGSSSGRLGLEDGQSFDRAALSALGVPQVRFVQKIGGGHRGTVLECVLVPGCSGGGSVAVKLQAWDERVKTEVEAMMAICPVRVSSAFAALAPLAYTCIGNGCCGFLCCSVCFEGFSVVVGVVGRDVVGG